MSIAKNSLQRILIIAALMFAFGICMQMSGVYAGTDTYTYTVHVTHSDIPTDVLAEHYDSDPDCNLTDGFTYNSASPSLPVYCLDGYYGTTCNGECDPNCIKCDNISGTCYQCKEGYYPKDKVCYSCPENCDGECPGGICIKCKKGFYGDICNETCSIYCVNNTCDKKDGLCDCINYFWRESHCTKCINHFDIETKCTECIKHY